MNILGINGWIERGHDAAACLIMDGSIVAIGEEERFIRKKHAFDVLPINAIAYCLYQASITPDEIDVIAWGWDLPFLYSLHGRKFTHNTQSLNNLIFPKKYYPSKRKNIPIEFVNHHQAHAASSYCLRKADDDVAIIVIDGAGENTSISIFLGHHGKISIVKSFSMTDSLGFFYEAACQYVGFLRTQAGKLMGLSAYGHPSDYQEFFQLGLDGETITTPFQNLTLYPKGVLDWEDEIVSEWLKVFKHHWGEITKAEYIYSTMKGKIQPNLCLGQKEKMIAATIQKEFERVYVWLVDKAIKLTGAKNIALSGGSVLNCSANGTIVDIYKHNNIYIQPMANDAGTALGAAVMMLPEIPRNLFSSPYLGPNYTPKDIFHVLRQSKIHFIEPTDIYQKTAEELADGKVIAWFDGRMEVGPRALGARSILADPRKKKMHLIVNNIKSREQWRPLAPSVLNNFANQYFTGSTISPHMLIRNYIKPEYMSEVPAIIHIDGSVRPQMVSQHTNVSYYRLIDAFYKLTGIPMLLNTSFNNDREPIICTPINAINTYFETGIDLLVMGPYMVQK